MIFHKWHYLIEDFSERYLIRMFNVLFSWQFNQICAILWTIRPFFHVQVSKRYNDFLNLQASLQVKKETRLKIRAGPDTKLTWYPATGYSVLVLGQIPDANFKIRLETVNLGEYPTGRNQIKSGRILDIKFSISGLFLLQTL